MYLFIYVFFINSLIYLFIYIFIFIYMYVVYTHSVHPRVSVSHTQQAGAKTHLQVIFNKLKLPGFDLSLYQVKTRPDTGSSIGIRET